MSFSAPSLQVQPESFSYLGLPSKKDKNTSSRAGYMNWFGDCGGGGWIFCLLACLLFVCLCHDLNMDCIGSWYRAKADLGFKEICLPLSTLAL